MDSLWFDIVGWVGSVLLVGAYWLISQNKVEAISHSYQWLNLVGSMLLIINGTQNINFFKLFMYPRLTRTTSPFCIMTS
jgi:hypothetical protein